MAGGKGRKQSRKRKSQRQDDEPQFIATTYHGIEESLPLYKDNPTQPQLDEPRGANDEGEELNQDAGRANAPVEEPIIDSEAATDGGEELNKDSDWCDKECKVAEGRYLSCDEMKFVNNVPLGPNSVKVVVETAFEVDAFLWRPAPKIYTIGQAVGETVAWPQDSVHVLQEEIDTDDILCKSPETVEKNKCKLLHWLTHDEETVAEGRWESRDPKALVDGLPLGPNAVKVYVDAVTVPQTFLWRPTEKHSNLVDCLKTYVAWPVSRVIFDNLDTESPATSSPHRHSQLHTPPAPAKISKLVAQTPSSSQKIVKEGQKCKLLDITGQKVVVAEGRWSSNNPEQLVHFVPLGKNAVRVWVDVVKVDDAMVWRPTSAIECMEDAIGTTIAWPEDKVVIV